MKYLDWIDDIIIHSGHAFQKFHLDGIQYRTHTITNECKYELESTIDHFSPAIAILPRDKWFYVGNSPPLFHIALALH